MTFNALQMMDKNVLDYIQSLRSDFLDTLMPLITFLGDAGLFWITWAVVLCFFKKTRKTGILMIAALALTFVVSTIGLKHLFSRLRPCVQFPKEFFYACPSGFSFPSGHSISSFSAAGVLFFRHEKGGFIALIIAAMIAFSRMYLYVHFPSDVLIGSLSGMICAYLIVWYDRVKKKAEV